jgi:methyl coenzyme M reductase beta subunit
MHNASDFGAVLFGVVVGWITYRTLVRRAGAVALSDIATVIGAVGGGAVVGLFDNKHLFGLYSIGLAAGFFAYLLVFYKLNGRQRTGEVMGDGEHPVKIPE